MYIYPLPRVGKWQMNETNNQYGYDKKEIIEKYLGQFGVFTHDMYKASDHDYATGFLSAFKKYGEAFKFANENGKDTTIHLI